VQEIDYFVPIIIFSLMTVFYYESLVEEFPFFILVGSFVTYFFNVNPYIVLCYFCR